MSEGPEDPETRFVGINAGLNPWSAEAFEVLIGVAGTFGGIVTYGDLAVQVQKATGLQTRSPQRNWIGKVLAVVARRCQSQQLPALTALVVHKSDGQVGDGYREVLELAGLDPILEPLEREQHAAVARLECYRRWSRDVPADAQPTLSPMHRQLLARRAPRREVPRPPVCDRCHMQLPVTGLCETCDG